MFNFLCPWHVLPTTQVGRIINEVRELYAWLKVESMSSAWPGVHPVIDSLESKLASITDTILTYFCTYSAAGPIYRVHMQASPLDVFGMITSG
jgi:hypothetical protein